MRIELGLSVFNEKDEFVFYDFYPPLEPRIIEANSKKELLEKIKFYLDNLELS